MKRPIPAHEYQRLATRTANVNADLANWALGVAGEAGEVADLIKKHRYHGHPLDTTELADELGDVLWYIAVLCTATGLQLEDVFAGNIEKLAARYPAGFDEERSRNR